MAQEAAELSHKYNLANARRMNGSDFDGEQEPDSGAQEFNSTQQRYQVQASPEDRQHARRESAGNFNGPKKRYQSERNPEMAHKINLNSVRGDASRSLRGGAHMPHGTRGTHHVPQGSRVANKVNLKEKAKAVVKTAQEAKELISTLSTPLGIFQLLKYIDFLKDGTYISALGVAVFDDTIDFTGLTDAAPVILGFIMGICTESYMSGMYFLGSYIEGGEMSQIQRQFIRRSIAMILGIIVEAIPVVDIIPSETLIGVVIFAFVLAERKRKADKEKAAAGVATS